MLNIREFRNDEFVNRDDEIKFLKEWFDKTPKEILWMYGPKSTGKTTLIEYVIENELFDDFKLFKSEQYNIKYINFRRKIIGNYKMFLDSIIKAEDNDEVSVNLNLGVLRLSKTLYDKTRSKEEDVFDVLMDYFKQSKKKNILVIDEIQVLEDIYIDNEKELLKEFLNFCVRLTKETHLAHVIILSSNTIFINEIYNHSKLKVTSEFKEIQHMSKETTFEYLKIKGFNDEEIEMIWEYIGGCIPLLQKMINLKQYEPTLKDYLEKRTLYAKSEIMMSFGELLMKDKIYLKDDFMKVIKKIIEDGYYLLDFSDKNIFDVVTYFAEKEILFFDPLSNKVTGNNRTYEKAFEKMIEENS